MIDALNRYWWAAAAAIALAAVAACGAAKSLYEDETPSTVPRDCAELTATTLDCEGQ